jgi:hypothetical protein
VTQRNPHLVGPLAGRVRVLTCVASVLIMTGLSTLGCADSTPPTTQRSNSVLNDPINYKPSEDDFPSVSGGGTGHFDNKGFKRDLDSVLNP